MHWKGGKYPKKTRLDTHARAKSNTSSVVETAELPGVLSSVIARLEETLGDLLMAAACGPRVPFERKSFSFPRSSNRTLVWTKSGHEHYTHILCEVDNHKDPRTTHCFDKPEALSE